MSSAAMAERCRDCARAEVRRLVQVTPQQLWGDLFVDLQMQSDDCKAFADAYPRSLAPAELLALYAAKRGERDFELAAFVSTHFVLPEVMSLAPPEGGLPGQPIRAHIRSLWRQLTRAADAAPEFGSLLPLSHAYVVPGGRFREIYYWDSHFTLIGLLADGEQALAQGLVANCADLIDRFGHVPNGNRSYYLSRSQPPLLFKMAQSLGEPRRWLAQLRREHAYWMRGEQNLAPGQAHAHLVRLRDGSLLNRYWDALDLPRDEAYRADVHTASLRAQRPAREIWRDLRAAAESGWDFSSRWCAEPASLAHIATTDWLPVDLNALLWGLERAIAEASEDAAVVDEFSQRAERRRVAIERHLWREDLQHFVDYDWQSNRPADALTAATVCPLFVGLASVAQAQAVADLINTRLLQSNGLATTLVESGQQWDAPNGWAPLQWMAIQGLRDYGHADLAEEIARRWLGTVERVFNQTGRLLEKYDMQRDLPGGGGEYPTQDGFGWTNGCYAALRELYPASG